MEKECDDFKTSIADHIKKAQEVGNISLKIPDKTKSVIDMESIDYEMDNEDLKRIKRRYLHYGKNVICYQQA